MQFLTEVTENEYPKLDPCSLWRAQCRTVSAFRPYYPTLALVVTSHVSANHWIHCYFDSP